MYFYLGKARAEALVNNTREDFESHLGQLSQEELKLLSLKSDLLLLAFEKFGPDILKFMLGKSFDISKVSTDGRALLHRACQRGSQALVEFLLSHGAEVDPEWGHCLGQCHAGEAL